MAPMTNLPLPLPLPTASVQPGAEAPTGAGSFKNVLLEALDQVNSMQSEANEAVQQLVTGGDVNPAEVLTTLQKADMALRGRLISPGRLT